MNQVVKDIDILLGGFGYGNFGRPAWLHRTRIPDELLFMCSGREIVISEVFYINSADSNRIWTKGDIASNQMSVGGGAAPHKPS